MAVGFCATARGSRTRGRRPLHGAFVRRGRPRAGQHHPSWRLRYRVRLLARRLADPVRQLANEHGTLFSVKPDGSDPVQLSPPALSVIDLGFFDFVGADWAPDSSRVAFAAFDQSSRRTGLFVVNADGSGLRQITPSGIGGLSAQWSPNGDLRRHDVFRGLSFFLASGQLPRRLLRRLRRSFTK
jgi:hypothetical protein